MQRHSRTLTPASPVHYCSALYRERWRSKSQRIVEALKGIHGLEAHVQEGSIYQGPTVPTTPVAPDNSWDGSTSGEIVQALVKGDPLIGVNYYCRCATIILAG